jgi:hypothetical protein
MKLVNISGYLYPIEFVILEDFYKAKKIKLKIRK